MSKQRHHDRVRDALASKLRRVVGDSVEVFTELYVEIPAKADEFERVEPNRRVDVALESGGEQYAFEIKPQTLLTMGNHQPQIQDYHLAGFTPVLVTKRGYFDPDEFHYHPDLVDKMGRWDGRVISYTESLTNVVEFRAETDLAVLSVQSGDTI